MENKNGCHLDSGSCGSQAHTACESDNDLYCPVEKSMGMWADASRKAWKEVHVELLKERIFKMWGPQMEKTADAVIESMGLEWKAMLEQVKAKEDLEQKISNIFSEETK